MHPARSLLSVKFLKYSDTVKRKYYLQRFT